MAKTRVLSGRGISTESGGNTGVAAQAVAILDKFRYTIVIRR
jgi:cysteine synthase